MAIPGPFGRTAAAVLPTAPTSARRTAVRTVILRRVIVATSQTTWDWIGQILVWFVGFPIFLGGIGTYIAVQIVAERRENQKTAGRWGLAAKSKRDGE
jgi:hypothetical protein